MYVTMIQFQVWWDHYKKINCFYFPVADVAADGLICNKKNRKMRNLSYFERELYEQSLWAQVIWILFIFVFLY